MGATIVGGSSNQLWTYIKTVENTNTNTLDITAIPAYEEYMILGFIKPSSGANSLMLTMNDDAGAHYSSSILAGGAVGGASTGTTAISLFSLTTTKNSLLQMYLIGKSPAVVNGVIAGHCMGNYAISFCGFEWIAGNNVQLTKLTFTGAGAVTFSSIMEIYGRNHS